AVIEKWRALIGAARWDELTEDLLIRHYDPAYTRSTLKHYPGLSRAPRLRLTAATDAEFMRLAQQCLAEESGTPQ
ncbi:MAG TPA: hypothetical protein VJ834_03475, partial [Burkholderiales bacterium]|nr:hypothetical protein [Burkholderiales bacterium]